MLAKGQEEKLKHRDAFKNTPDLHQNDAIMRKKLAKFFEGIEDILIILEYLPERQIRTVISPDILKTAFKLSEALLPFLDPPQIRLKDERGSFVTVEGVKLFYLDPPEENAVPHIDETGSSTMIKTFGPSVSWEISSEEYKLIATIARHIGTLKTQITPARETLPDTGVVKFQGEIIPKLKEEHGEKIRAKLDFFVNIGETDLETIIAFFENHPTPQGVETTPDFSEE